MTWHEWIEIRIDNRTAKDVAITNFENKQGWCYNLGDVGRAVVEDSNINKRTIPKKSDMEGFGHRGRAGWFSGCEGSFDMVFKGEKTKLCHVYYNCPYWSSANTFTVTDRVSNAKYVVDYIGGTSYGAAIGGVTIRVKQIDV